ncbi:MAG TPA: hypothetical protein EYP07_15720 [Kiloniellaceae bacterium]|nr:hypothetical protein [Kiloniellaceae bacterium]
MRGPAGFPAGPSLCPRRSEKLRNRKANREITEQLYFHHISAAKRTRRKHKKDRKNITVLYGSVKTEMPSTTPVWRGCVIVFFLAIGLFAFPRSAQVPWITTAEARPIPPRIAIAPERLNLAVSEGRAATETADHDAVGP